MEQNFDVELAKVGMKTKESFDKTKLILPGAILIAAIMISGTLFFINYATLPAPAGGQPAVGNNNSKNPVQVTVGDSPYLGNKNAKITVVEFADFRCPFCERFFQDAEKQIIANYVNTGKAKFVFKHYAFLGQESVWVSEAAECANEQDKFWEYHDWLYDNQALESDLAYYSKANLIKYAGRVGLDVNKFSFCLSSDKYSSRVNSDYSQGQSAGVTGTPTVFINGQMIVGAQPFSVFKTAIDALIK